MVRGWPYNLKKWKSNFLKDICEILNNYYSLVLHELIISLSHNEWLFKK